MLLLPYSISVFSPTDKQQNAPLLAYKKSDGWIESVQGYIYFLCQQALEKKRASNASQLRIALRAFTTTFFPTRGGGARWCTLSAFL